MSNPETIHQIVITKTSEGKIRVATMSKTIGVVTSSEFEGIEAALILTEVVISVNLCAP